MDRGIERFRQRVEAVGAPADNHETGARRGEAARHCGADAGRGPGDENGRVGEIGHGSLRPSNLL